MTEQIETNRIELIKYLAKNHGCDSNYLVYVDPETLEYSLENKLFNYKGSDYSIGSLDYVEEQKLEYCGDFVDY